MGSASRSYGTELVRGRARARVRVGAQREGSLSSLSMSTSGMKQL